MIDKYIILTTPRNLKREYLVYGGTTARGVPPKKIHFFLGRDARDFQNSLAAVAEAAADDGYPFLRQFGVGMQGPWVKQSAGNVALFWNWARILGVIADAGETVMLIWDDRIPTVDWEVLEEGVHDIKSQDNFYLWQLRVRAHVAHCEVLKRPRLEWQDVEQNMLLFKEAMRSRHLDFTKKFLQKGLIGYDESMVLSPAGARWLLEQMLKMPTIVTVSPHFEFAEPPKSDIRECEELNIPERARLNNDNWLCWDPTLQENIAKAIKDKCGIYTSKRLGYDFVQDWLPRASTVEWATTETGASEDATKLQYMEV